MSLTGIRLLSYFFTSRKTAVFNPLKLKLKPSSIVITSYSIHYTKLYDANGYVVLYTNPRGSSGYGAEFGNSIKNAYPGKDFDDLMKGVDEVIARGYVDSDNMFV